jgi:hypothetical protein
MIFIYKSSNFKDKRIKYSDFKMRQQVLNQLKLIRLQVFGSF